MLRMCAPYRLPEQVMGSSSGHFTSSEVAPLSLSIMPLSV